MNIIKRSGLLIPTEYENKEFFVKIKEHLLRRTQAYQNSTFDILSFYLQSDDYLLVPRFFPLKDYVGGYTVEDMRHEGAPIKIEHNIIPRSEAQKKAMAMMMNSESGILQLSPGVGKTVISIYMIAERKRKSLILVHRDALAEQWRNRLKQFTNLEDDDIVRLSSAKFEEELDKPIIIATTQTFLSLLKRNRHPFLRKLNESNIGIFIADEVHTSVGAPTFSECSIHMPSKYTYGLSATPYRYDGNGDIIEYHLGEIYADSDSDTMDARVTVILLDYQIDTPRSYTYIRWGGEFQRARYLNRMKKSENFNTVVRALLSKLKDRNLICMVERVKLIEELYKWMPSNNKAMFCGKGGLETLDCNHTFATPGKCRDGVDAPHKDCVLITSPISNMEQLTGRIVRPMEGKPQPIIIDMVDYGCRDMSSSLYGRLKFYEGKEWPVQFLLVTQSGPIQIDKEKALEIINGVVQ